MFDIGWSEMFIILVVALLVVGPRDLPRFARTLGQWTGKARRMAREFQRGIDELARESELDKVRDEINKVGRTDIKKRIEKEIDPDEELYGSFDLNAPGAKRKTAKADGGNGSAEAAAVGDEASERERLAPPHAPPEPQPAEADAGAANNKAAERAAPDPARVNQD